MKSFLAAPFLLGLATIAVADSKADDKRPLPADAPKCRAVDADSKTIAEASEASLAKCGTLLMEAVRVARCTADMKGKKVDYTVSADHVIGNAKVKDRKTSLTCTSSK